MINPFVTADGQDEALPKKTGRDLTGVSWFLQILLLTPNPSRWETSTWGMRDLSCPNSTAGPPVLLLASVQPLAPLCS